MAFGSPFIRLRCPVESHAHGKRGSSSLAARYAAATPENSFKIDEAKSYGEIWIGDHPHGASTTLDGTPLKMLIEADPDTFLTPEVSSRFSPNCLPFLVKILSLSKALPLQAHPNDSEVIVALSDKFEAFVGFRPVPEIQAFLKIVPELRKVLPDHPTVEKFLSLSGDVEAAQGLLKTMFSQLLRTKPTEIHACTQQLQTHIERGSDDALGTQGLQKGLARAIQKAMKENPEEVGLFAAAFFLNYIQLNKGEAILIPKECIHAYLEGDAIHCAAQSSQKIVCDIHSSDQVKYADSFAQLPQYLPRDPANLRLKHSTWKRSAKRKTEIYNSPSDEYDLLHTVLHDGEEEHNAEGIPGPAVFVVTHGQVVMSATKGGYEEPLHKGQICFVKPNCGYIFHAKGETEIWGAFVEV